MEAMFKRSAWVRPSCRFILFRAKSVSVMVTANSYVTDVSSCSFCYDPPHVITLPSRVCPCVCVKERQEVLQGVFLPHYHH